MESFPLWVPVRIQYTILARNGVSVFGWEYLALWWYCARSGHSQVCLQVWRRFFRKGNWELGEGSRRNLLLVSFREKVGEIMMCDSNHIWCWKDRLPNRHILMDVSWLAYKQDFVSNKRYWYFWHICGTQKFLKLLSWPNFSGVFSMLACTKSCIFIPLDGGSATHDGEKPSISWHQTNVISRSSVQISGSFSFFLDWSEWGNV